MYAPCIVTVLLEQSEVVVPCRANGKWEVALRVWVTVPDALVLQLCVRTIQGRLPFLIV